MFKESGNSFAGLCEKRESVGEENGLKIQREEFLCRAAELSGICAIFVGEEGESVEVDESISQHEMGSVAPGGLARGGPGEFEEGKACKGIVFREPHIGFHFPTGGLWSVDGGGEFFPEEQAFALMIAAGEGDGVESGHGKEFFPGRHCQGERIENHPTQIGEDGRAGAFATHVRMESVPDGESAGDPIQFGNRFHTSKNRRSLPRNPAL